MSLLLTEDQQLLQDSAKNFCQQNAAVSELRALRDAGDELGYSQALWQQMVDLGWPGMAVEEAHGGFEFGYAGLGLLLQETGRTLVSSPLIATVLLGATAISKLGSESQKQSLLPSVVAGELRLALAVDETAIHQPEKITTTAAKNETGYLLNGSKTFVLDGHVADKLIVVATVADSAGNSKTQLFLVNSEQAGVNIQRTHMVDNRNAARITFSDVQLDPASLLGEDDSLDCSPILEQILDVARIGIAAEMLGSIEQVFEMTIDYLKQREQFGVLIGSFQGLQHRAATMYSEIELCRSIVRAAILALDDDSMDAADLARLASAAKAKLSEVFMLVSNEGVQMHGGIGMTDEFDMGFYIKRARVAQHFLGDANFHRDRYATLSGF